MTRLRTTQNENLELLPHWSPRLIPRRGRRGTQFILIALAHEGKQSGDCKETHCVSEKSQTNTNACSFLESESRSALLFFPLRSHPEGVAATPTFGNPADSNKNNHSALHTRSLAGQLQSTGSHHTGNWSHPDCYFYLMLSHLAFWAPAGLEALAQLCLHGLHFGRNGLERVLVLLLAFQSFIESPLFLTDLYEKGDLTNGFLLLILQVVTFLSSPLYPRASDCVLDV